MFYFTIKFIIVVCVILNYHFKLKILKLKRLRLASGENILKKMY